MADGAAPYPPAPLNVPPRLTAPTASYRARVLVVLTSLLLFAFLYLGLVAGSAYLCYWSFASLGAGPESKSGRDLLQETSRTGERLIGAFNDALRRRQQGVIDDRGFLQVLERDLLPPWRNQRRRLDQARGLPREEQRLVEQCGESFRLQEESWELLARAV